MNSFLQAFLEGDERVFRQIYNSEASQRIRKDVHFKGGSAEEAEDVVVLSILKVQELVRTGKYKDQEKFYGYLRTVGSYIYKEERHKKFKAPYREKEVLVDDESSLILEAGVEFNSFELEMESLEEKITISKHIKSLGRRDQEIIRLRYFEGLSLVDIGKKLSIKQPNVAHFRILKRLRKILDKKQGQ
ncbi:MAG: sigma-70 family RNA polymerase sigma factor [Saprospiraceae bacterium]|nr:sigma-70 family RNA polymerase sigma factor [Saprospiraceae bacterium]